MIKNINLILFLVIFPLSVFAAKPTDTQVLKDITSPRMNDIKLSQSGGTFSTYNLQHWWTRGVTYKIDAGISEFPDAKIIVGAEARYRIVGENYDFDKLKTAWNQYEGIPMPADLEILTLLKSDLVNFVQAYNWNRIISKLEGPKLSSDAKIRKVEWHTANSFSIHLQANYSVASSYTEIQDLAVDYEVRLYRDGVNKPWSRFISSKSKEDIIAKHTYTADEINAMPTLASRAAEIQASSQLSGLPQIKIPKFNSDKDAFTYIYNVLRTSDEKQVEAMFRAMASHDYYVEGSKIRLNNRGNETLEKLLKQVFNNKISFAKSYCPQILVKSYQANMINVVDALRKNKSRFALMKSGGRYERGKKVDQEYKITAIDIWTLRTDDDVAQLKSWPFEELCADTAKSFKQLTVGSTTPQKKTTTKSVASSQAVKNTSTASIKTPVKRAGWKLFKSKYLPIKMKIIGDADEKQSMANGKLATKMTANSTDGTFQMVATDYKQEITAEIATPTHVQFAKNFVKSNNALIHKKKVIQLGIGDALDYVIERGSGEKKVMVNFRIFSKGTVVYQVVYTQFKNKYDKKIAEKFMQSIMLL